jgi:uncharacterized protein (DUF305 family)
MKKVTIMTAVMLLAGCGEQEAAVPIDDKQTGKVISTPADMTDSQKAYLRANNKMHGGMMADIPEDADEAFMAGMIPHHQGAVDMAKIALEHGKDPEVRALAQKVIAAQQAEIKEMQAWLNKRGVKPAAKPMTEADHKAMGH